jgi:hypothetical protein
MIKQNGSGSNFMNLGGAGDPLHKMQFNNNQNYYVSNAQQN